MNYLYLLLQMFISQQTHGNLSKLKIVNIKSVAEKASSRVMLRPEAKVLLNLSLLPRIEFIAQSVFEGLGAGDIESLQFTSA